MHRPTVGLIALALLAGAAGCYLFGWGSLAIESAFWRIGLIMALLWLALPELLHVRGKFAWGLLVPAVLIVILRPKLAPVVIIFAAAYAVLRPRRRARERQSDEVRGKARR